MKFTELIVQRTYDLLNAKNWSVYKLAARSAIPNSTLAHVLSCQCKTVSSEILINICRGFDIPIYEFFTKDMFEFENISDD